MKTKSKHSKHHLTTVNGNNKLQQWWIFTIVFVIVAAGILVYFSQNRPPAKLPTNFTDNFGDTFDNKPISAFPPELILSGFTVQQYFDNATYSGVLFKTDESPAQVEASYQTALASSTWSVVDLSSSTPSQENVFGLMNQQTGKDARVTMNTVPNNMTMVVVAVQK